MDLDARNRRLSRLLTKWLCKCEGGHPPADDALPLDELRFILPDLCLIDVVGEGDYRFRLAGTGIVERLHCNPVGRPLAVLGTRAGRAAAALFAATVAHAAPVAASWELELGAGDLPLDALCLPLADADGAVRTLLVGISFHA